jgi:hypothetical protein
VQPNYNVLICYFSQYDSEIMQLRLPSVYSLDQSSLDSLVSGHQATTKTLLK